MISPLSPTGLCLLFLAITVQATSSISLGGNFQQLPFGITGQCRRVYNQPIENCSAQDFQVGGVCSQACVISLQNLSNTLNIVCPGVIVDSRTLLGRIFQNMLLESVCSAVEVPVQSATPTEIVTTPTDTAIPVTTSQEPGQSTTTEASPTITSEKAKSSAVLGIGDPDPTSDSTSRSTTMPTSESTRESTPEPTTSEGQVPQSTTSSEQEEPTSRSREQQEIDANRFSGGGSPFDNIVADSGALNARNSLISSLAGAILAAIILVW
ncbi:hypothetical protein V491_02485 [Pseudogymnoascus sp. VKM F-3775]|nr:hypothetical protein V491_02485 [Pseudogymnoascus sp. VKM F-3775]